MKRKNIGYIMLALVLIALGLILLGNVFFGWPFSLQSMLLLVVFPAAIVASMFLWGLRYWNVYLLLADAAHFAWSMRLIDWRQCYGSLAALGLIMLGVLVFDRAARKSKQEKQLQEKMNAFSQEER